MKSKRLIKGRNKDNIMSNLNAKEYENFESIKVVREDGTEYWSARELSQILGYKKWEKFSKVVDKAMLACKNSGLNILDHFPDVSKIVDTSATQRKVLDYELSRYACYLIVQNGDPRKEVIALEQTLLTPEKSIKQVEKELIKGKKNMTMLDE